MYNDNGAEWCDCVYDKISSMVGKCALYIDTEIYSGYKLKKSVCDSMINCIDSGVWHNTESKVVDLYVQDTMLMLYIVYNFNKGLKDKIPDDKERMHHIVNNNIYAIFTDEIECKVFKSLLGITGRNVRYYKREVLQNGKGQIIEEANRIVKESFGMNFDVVVGNPPYNRGADIDFIDLSYRLSTGSTIMIVPGKWQTAESEHRIVSNMSYGGLEGSM